MKKLFCMAAALIFLCACANWSGQQKGTAAGTGIGAAIGAGLGQAIGGDTEATLIGAAAGALVGGIAGNRVGAYMDRQEQALRDAVAMSDAASIQRSQDVLTATFKSDVLFDFNSAALKPGAYREMDRVAGVLRDYPQTSIRIEGHTDKQGSEAYNQQLSEKRALAVKNALVQKGVQPSRMQTIGYGEGQPVASNDAMNRRVNVVITPIMQG